MQTLYAVPHKEITDLADRALDAVSDNSCRKRRPLRSVRIESATKAEPMSNDEAACVLRINVLDAESEHDTWRSSDGA